VLKTTEELVAYYESKKEDDFLGAIFGDIAVHLPKDVLQPLCADGTDLSQMEEPLPCTREYVLKAMKSYMDFAWGKATGHRGISAGRSIQHFESWLWMLGDEEAIAFVQDESHYPQYGCPMLKYICNKYGFDIPDSDDVKRMCGGQPCGDSDCGCGT